MIVGGEEMVPISIVICSKNESLVMHRERERERCPFTSSTAQGGGGSFKNRKPIGDVGCCESGMAERSH